MKNVFIPFLLASFLDCTTFEKTNAQSSLIIKDVQTILPIKTDSAYQTNEIKKIDRDNLFRAIMEGLYSKKLVAYENYPNKELSLMEVNTKLTPWDSTAVKEDPYNPGVFINAPFKKETNANDILFIKFHEDIMFDTLTYKMNKEISYLTLYWYEVNPKKEALTKSESYLTSS